MVGHLCFVIFAKRCQKPVLKLRLSWLGTKKCDDGIADELILLHGHPQRPTVGSTIVESVASSGFEILIACVSERMKVRYSDQPTSRTLLCNIVGRLKRGLGLVWQYQRPLSREASERHGDRAIATNNGGGTIITGYPGSLAGTGSICTSNKLVLGLEHV